MAAAVPRVAIASDGPDVGFNLRLVEAPGQPSALVLDAIVTGAPANADRSKWTLVQVDHDPPVIAPAIGLRSRVDDLDCLSIALVVEGHKMFVGTDEYEVDADQQVAGMFSTLPGIVDIISKADGNPRSTGTVIAYGRGSWVLAPTQPLAKLRRDVFGKQSAYELEVTRDLVNGAGRAVEALKFAPCRRAVVIIGDGSDTATDTGRARLAEVRKEAELSRVDVYAVNYSAGIGDDLTAIKALVERPTIVGTVDEIHPAVQAIVDRINNRFVLTFEVTPLPRRACDFHVQLRLDGKAFPGPDAEPIPITSYPPCIERPSRASASKTQDWHWAVLFSVGVVAAVGVMAFFVRRRRASRRAIASSAEVR